MRSILVVVLPGFLMLVCTSYQLKAESVNEFQTIEALYEPSGVVQLDDGRLLVVEDEPEKPFVLLTMNSEIDVHKFSAHRLRPNILFHRSLFQISDLEGVAKDATGGIYAITSQSRKSNGKREAIREKIVKFSIKGKAVTTSNSRNDFRKKLIKAYPFLKEASKERRVKDMSGLNIEGLTFSHEGSVLWIGLRAPLIQGKAIVIPLLNPRAALEAGADYRFAKEPVFLELDGGGIRDIAFIPLLSGYLILSQREDSTKKERAFKLWLWGGEADIDPIRVKIAGIKKLKRTEGVAPVRLNGEDYIMLLNDDGDRTKGKFGSYVLLDYASLLFD